MNLLSVAGVCDTPNFNLRLRQENNSFYMETLTPKYCITPTTCNFNVSYKNSTNKTALAWQKLISEATVAIYSFCTTGSLLCADLHYRSMAGLAPRVHIQDGTYAALSVPFAYKIRHILVKCV